LHGADTERVSEEGRARQQEARSDQRHGWQAQGSRAGEPRASPGQ
jgi:hypothetical protein